jgi:nitrate/TMAO reductase-like tetraheme cytochrome c subunit
MKAKIKIFVGLLIAITLILVNLVQAQKLDESGKLVGKWDFIFKCGKCHSLERALSKNKTPEQWKETVQTMHKKGHGWIAEEQVEEIVYFLSSKSLFETKCKNCHSEFRALDLIKNKEEWTKTVKAMQKKVPHWITDEEADRIIIYLYSVQGGM